MDRRWALLTLYLIVFVDFFQLTFVFPFIPMIVASFGGSVGTISARVAYLSSLAAIGQMIGSPLLGSLSDRIGRKPIFLVSTIGSALSSVMLGLAGSWEAAAASRFVNGITGGTVALANTFLIDITEEEERPKLMSRMTGMIGLGLTFGPIAGGYLYKEFDVQVACYWSGALSVLNFLFIVFLLVDAKQVRNGNVPAEADDQQADGQRQDGDNGSGAAAAEEEARGTEAPAAVAVAAAVEEPVRSSLCRRCLRMCCRSSSSGRLSFKLYLLFISGMFVSPISVVFDTFANLYVTERFYSGDENPEQAGTMLFSNCVATIGVFVLIIPFLLYQPFLKLVGFSGSIVIGTATIAVGLVCNGLATAPWMFLASTALWAFGFQLRGPVLPVLIGRLAPKESVGRAFGLFQSFANISMVIGPTALTPLYNWYHPAVFFILGGSLSVTGVIHFYLSVTTAPPRVPTVAGCDGEPDSQAPEPEMPAPLVRQISREVTPNILQQLGGELARQLQPAGSARTRLLDRVSSEPSGQDVEARPPDNLPQLARARSH